MGRHSDPAEDKTPNLEVLTPPGEDKIDNKVIADVFRIDGAHGDYEDEK